MRNTIYGILLGMKVFMFSRDGRDYSRAADEFVENMRRRYKDREITLVNLDTREGDAQASLYDITQYPAIVVADDDGRPRDSWQGLPLPLIDEVMGTLIN